MIDLWFIALMVIPTNEVIVHCITYLSRIKSSQDKAKPESVKVNVNKKITSVNFPYTPPTTNPWDILLEDSKGKRVGKNLRRITYFCNIFMPIFFVIFLITFILIGIRLKYKR